jgi:hypothetical protein
MIIAFLQHFLTVCPCGGPSRYVLLKAPFD